VLSDAAQAHHLAAKPDIGPAAKDSAECEAYKATDTVQGTHATYTQSMDGHPRPTRQRQKQQTLFIRTHHCSSEPAKHLNDLPHHHAYRFKEYSRVFINILT
jgi:hypothetical protein